ncbi:response regulator [Salmonella enterica]|nr:response regulator [Salmonella enterica]
MRIMILEQSRREAQMLKQHLKRHGYCADWFEEPVSALQAARVTPYGAVIISAGMWETDPERTPVMAWWRRQHREEPVLYLAMRDQPATRLNALHAGADDCIGKPCDREEIVLRLRRLLCFREIRYSNHRLTHRNVVLEPLSGRVLLGGEEVIFPRMEMALLQILMQNKNRAMSRQWLEERLYSWELSVGSNTVEVYICNLRRRLGRDFIVTVRGTGYRLGDERVQEC